MATPAPRCAYCNVQGLNHLAAKPAGFLLVIFCKACGAIHEIIAPPTQAENATSEPDDLDLRPTPGAKP
jgi:hypothetical protein